MGPRGFTGAQGEPGVGTRTVYQSTMPIPTDDYTIAIPEITLNDMPSISIYVNPFGVGLWTELPYYFEGYPDWGHMAFITEGHVTFLLCRTFFYKIVIIR